MTAETPKTQPPQSGEWTLIAPNGRAWFAESPIKCVRAEQRDRIPASVALERIFAAAQEGEPTDADLLRLAHAHKYDGPPEADKRIVAMLRAARDWMAPSDGDGTHPNQMGAWS